MCHKTRSLDKYETLDGTLSVHVIRNREAGVLKKILLVFYYSCRRVWRENGRVRSDERRNLSDDTKGGARRVGEIFNSLRGDAERRPGLICCRAITPVQYGIMDV